jgi:predicted LPLAT superfamily acyltransferase
LVDFLGGKIEVPFSVYRIAGALQVPVVVIFFPRKGAGRADSLVADTFFVDDKGMNPNNYIPEAQKYALALEKFSIEYPYQFFNYFNMWRNQ